ncbi:hypothetical protein [Nannocystis pusilla]|uniref:hypothetical protein n=1 Tax=Nannocystis pusilla TaxID=889268 RepID=UPI003B781B06
MRVWPVLLLLSCSRPNPLFFVGGASSDMSSGTDPATTAAATTDIGTTAPSTTGTTAGVTTSTPTTSTTGEPFTTGEPSTTAVSSTTGDEHPACGPFSEQRLILDPPLPEAQCVAVTEYFGKVTKTDDDGTIALCADALCALCPLSVPLDPDLALYVDDGDCLRVAHQGEWAPGDPEAPTGCKTTAIALFDDDSIYPLYAASSRVVEAPGFLDSAVRLDVQREAGTVCLRGRRLLSRRTGRAPAPHLHRPRRSGRHPRAGRVRYGRPRGRRLPRRGHPRPRQGLLRRGDPALRRRPRDRLRRLAHAARRRPVNERTCPRGHPSRPWKRARRPRTGESASSGPPPGLTASGSPGRPSATARRWPGWSCRRTRARCGSA